MIHENVPETASGGGEKVSTILHRGGTTSDEFQIEFMDQSRGGQRVVAPLTVQIGSRYLFLIRDRPVR